MAESYWLQRLRQRHQHIIDVMESATDDLNNAAKHLTFGLYVIPNAVPRDLLDKLHKAFAPTMQDIQNAVGSTKTAIGGSTDRYNMWQATELGYFCKYGYHSTGNHPLFHSDATDQPQSVMRTLQVVKDIFEKYKADTKHSWDLFVCNLYAGNQIIPWHDDKFALTSDDGPPEQQNVDICSITMYGSGVLAFQPNRNNMELWRQMGGVAQYSKSMTYLRGRGLVQVCAGDMVLMTGTFQEYTQHKTLRMSAWSTENGRAQRALAYRSVQLQLRQAPPQENQEYFRGGCDIANLEDALPRVPLRRCHECAAGNVCICGGGGRHAAIVARVAADAAIDGNRRSCLSRRWRGHACDFNRYPANFPRPP